MPAIRFKFEALGQTMHGIAFESEAALDAFLGGGRCLPTQTPLAPVNRGTSESETVEVPRPRGRPAFTRIIGEAVKALTLDPGDSLTIRANQVLRHLAKTRPADAELPQQRCVINFLADRSHGKNGGNKYGKKKAVRKCSPLEAIE